MYPGQDSRDQQLSSYIQQQLSYGVGLTQLRGSLLQAGWPVYLIDGALNHTLAHVYYQLPQPSPASVQRHDFTPAVSQHSPLSRFAVTTFAVLAAIVIPVILAVAWSLIIMNNAGSTAFNTVGAFTLVGAGLWIVASTIWYIRAPFIAATNDQLSVGGALAASYKLKTRNQ